MKVINHKDGSQSFKFSPKEMVCNSQEKKEALVELTDHLNGFETTLSDLLEGKDKKGEAFSFSGSEIQRILAKWYFVNKNTPAVQGALEIAIKEIVDKSWDDYEKAVYEKLSAMYLYSPNKKGLCGHEDGFKDEILFAWDHDFSVEKIVDQISATISAMMAHI